MQIKKQSKSKVSKQEGGWAGGMNFLKFPSILLIFP